VLAIPLPHHILQRPGVDPALEHRLGHRVVLAEIGVGTQFLQAHAAVEQQESGDEIAGGGVGGAKRHRAPFQLLHALDVAVGAYDDQAPVEGLAVAVQGAHDGYGAERTIRIDEGNVPQGSHLHVTVAQELDGFLVVLGQAQFETERRHLGEVVHDRLIGVDHDQGVVPGDDAEVDHRRLGTERRGCRLQGAEKKQCEELFHDGPPTARLTGPLRSLEDSGHLVPGTWGAFPETIP
jgi:hypothetical protein